MDIDRTEFKDYIDNLCEAYGPQKSLAMALICIFNTYRTIAEKDPDLYNSLVKHDDINLLLGWALGARKIGAKIYERNNLESMRKEGHKTVLQFIKECNEQQKKVNK